VAPSNRIGVNWIRQRQWRRLRIRGRFRQVSLSHGRHNAVETQVIEPLVDDGLLLADIILLGRIVAFFGVQGVVRGCISGRFIVFVDRI
jgi:hypothetical protein